MSLSSEISKLQDEREQESPRSKEYYKVFEDFKRIAAEKNGAVGAGIINDAIRAKDVKVLRVIRQIEGIEFDVRDEQGHYPIHVAILVYDSATWKELLSEAYPLKGYGVSDIRISQHDDCGRSVFDIVDSIPDLVQIHLYELITCYHLYGKSQFEKDDGAAVQRLAEKDSKEIRPRFNPLHAAVRMHDVCVSRRAIQNVAAGYGLLHTAEHGPLLLKCFNSPRESYSDLKILVYNMRQAQPFLDCESKTIFGLRDADDRTPIDFAVELGNDQFVLFFFQLHAEIIDLHTKLMWNLDQSNRPCEVC